jgi:non-ribosomal peptide synthetase component E (peptide arylation enzyme)
MLIDGDLLDRPAAPLNDLPGVGLAAAPDDVTLLSADRSLSWSELKAASAELAGGYRRLGLEAGDRIASLRSKEKK